MRHLILMRHAEAGYAAPGDKDIDRPLTPIGHKEAARQARFFHDHKLMPDLVLCSPAKRTQETWARVHEALADSLSIDFALHHVETLYQAASATIVQLVHAIPEHVDIALIVAHNPGIHEAALTLSQPLDGHMPSDLAVELQGGFPPASLAMFECKIRQWSEVTHENVTLRQFARAR